MTTADHGEIAAILDEQFDDYRAMRTMGIRQRNFLSCNDLDGLDDSFRKLRSCMDRIRLRESQLPVQWQEVADPGIDKRRADLRQIIGELDQIRLVIEQSVRDLLQETRVDLKRCHSGRKAVKNYLTPSGGPLDARFYDVRQ